jgi:hypothetical protein
MRGDYPVSTYCPFCGSDQMTRLKTPAESGNTRFQCRACKSRTTKPLSAPLKEPVKFNTSLPKAPGYVFTWAQNATPVNEAFFTALTYLCKDKGYKLVVIPGRYKNPTSRWTQAQQSEEWWSELVTPYLFAGREAINPSLMVVADIKAQPTAVLPLTGFETITGAMSGIVGHPKLQLKTIPTPHHKLPKVMMTTGACTVQNYTDSKAGKKGEFHHTFGACVVEIEGDLFHTRQINAVRDGSFIDLEHEYSAKGVKKAPPAAALVMGDTHVDFVDPNVVKATFTNKNSIVNTLKPQHLVWHDLLDFYVRNHHHRDNPFNAVAQYRAGYDSVMEEMERAAAFVEKHTPKGVINVFVPSNHPDALSRWIKDTDWRKDPANAQTYLETALEMVKSCKMTPNGATVLNPFNHWMKKLMPRSGQWELLNRDESYVINGIEVSQHGDLGPNGARGTLKNLSTIGVKNIIGHSHSPGIEAGTYQVGTSTLLRLEYNRGPSSWLHTHCIIYANGKRSLINIIEGHWRKQPKQRKAA